MTEGLSAPPVLSTPDTLVFEDPTPPIPSRSRRLGDEQVRAVYEIERTAREIRAGGWRTIALQFPDGMLCDAPRVSEALEAALKELPTRDIGVEAIQNSFNELDVTKRRTTNPTRERLAILADTSYGACCVDEIAAEHAEAEVVVHYGRSCLSPTARLPVIYVYTSHELSLGPVVSCFEATFPEKSTRVILMADVTYSNHLDAIRERLVAQGYTDIYIPAIVHDPSSPLPNRTIPSSVSLGAEQLNSYQLFHISDPPPALLLTLSSRLQSTYIYSTDTHDPSAIQAQSSRTLMRRYALLTSLSTCPIFGILINTLSVKNYIDTISSIQAQITAAGKKYYTMVVGKVNPAKIANFSEIGGWVVVGCWESSLIDSKEFYRPIITPFELGLALQSDEERVWTGEWRSDFDGLTTKTTAVTRTRTNQDFEEDREETEGQEEFSDDEDSAPPEYDLRTGRYVSHSRPMRVQNSSSHNTVHKEQITGRQSQALQKRVNGEIAMINGTASPGAEYLRQNRTWQGLGSDYEIKYEEEKGALIEEGRSGVARGYTVGEDSGKH